MTFVSYPHTGTVSSRHTVMRLMDVMLWQCADACLECDETHLCVGAGEQDGMVSTGSLMFYLNIFS